MNNDDYSGFRELCDPLTGEVFWVKTEHLLLDKEGATLSPCSKSGKNGKEVSPVIHSGITGDTQKSNAGVTWMKTMPSAIYYKISEADLSGKAQTLMWAIASFASWRGVAKCTHKQLSEKTGIARPNVTRIIRDLIDADVMIKLDGSRYRLNPVMCWIGPDDEHKKAVESYYRHRDRLEKQASMAAARSREMDTPEGRRKNFRVVSGQ